MPISAQGVHRTPRTTAALILVSLALIISALVTTSVASAAPAQDAGYRDHGYGSGVEDPTEDKPQSKLWFTDGFWWGGLFVDGPDTFQVHRYNASTHTWTSTGTVIEARKDSHQDYLWDGATNSLYVASVDDDDAGIVVYKLKYNPTTNTYAHDAAFTSAGVVVGQGPAETVTIAKDSTGQLWVTYDNAKDATNRDIMVNRSTTAEHTWGSAFSIATASADDISAIVAFGGNKVGIMWSDQNPVGNQTFFRFAIHSDSAIDTDWASQRSSVPGPDGFAEDHINIKLSATNSGRVIAAVKTEQNVHHIQLLNRNPTSGVWTVHPVVHRDFDPTRPQVVIDQTNARAYVFYTSPEDRSGGDQAIYYKSAPLSTLSFNTSGLGTAFIKDGVNDINNVATSKHNVTSSMGGILAIAASQTNTTYYHGWIPVSGGSTPTPTPTPDPGNPFTDVSSSNKFYKDILWAYDEGVTVGCTATKFCPKGAVTRAQMATFLVRVLDLPAATGPDRFDDDDGNKHEARINALAQAGITVGCGPRKFCPNGVVAREQMATFLTRAYSLAPSSKNWFTDDNNSKHEARINALAASGITRGCGPTTFCPGGTVNREQMAAFLHRAESR